MSKNNKNQAAPEEKAEKVMTKYDRKMQRRKEEKEKEERAKRITTGVTVVILLALVCLVLSFPIRTYLTLNKTFLQVGDDKVTKVEFDYYYNTVVNNYVSQYSQYLSWFGLDLSKDLSTQKYSDTRSWKDFFEEMTVESLRKNKALKADAKAKGFTYDVSKEYDAIVEQLKASAKEQGISLNKYLQQNYGSYSTLSRIKPYVEEALYVSAYNDKLSEDMTPAADAVKAKYDEDKKQYDSVDYRIQQFDAELPTEPTELADPVTETDETDEDAAYEPSEAEIAHAMDEAMLVANIAINTVKEQGESVTGISYSAANNVIRDWLFDDARKAGDVTVLEDESEHCYYTVAFEKRYLDETPTANVRVLVAESEDHVNEANAIFNEWKSGNATEDGFIELCDGKYIENSVADGGLLKGIAVNDDLYAELLDWIFAEGRKVGDCEVVTVPDVASFVMYYSGVGQASWYNDIESDLRSDAVNEYVDALLVNCLVTDPDGNLNYLVLEAQEKAAAESAAAESAAAESAVENE